MPIETSPEGAQQGPLQPSPRRSEYTADRAGDFFVERPSSCRLLEVNAAAWSQTIDHVLRPGTLEFRAVLASADLDVERMIQAIHQRSVHRCFQPPRCRPADIDIRFVAVPRE